MYVLLIRIVVLFFWVIIAMRIMGKRTIGELQASELVITLLISEIAALPMQDVSIPLIFGIMPIAVLVFLEVSLTFGILKMPWLGKLLCGRPVLVINKGKIEKQAMRSLRLSCDDLFEALRQQDVFDINTVNYAIMETNGRLSVLKKDDTQKLLIMPLVSDGKIDGSSMKVVGWDQERLLSALRKGGQSVGEIFIMTADENKVATLITNESDNGGKKFE